MTTAYHAQLLSQYLLPLLQLLELLGFGGDRLFYARQRLARVARVQCNLHLHRGRCAGAGARVTVSGVVTSVVLFHVGRER